MRTPLLDLPIKPPVSLSRQCGKASPGRKQLALPAELLLALEAWTLARPDSAWKSRLPAKLGLQVQHDGLFLEAVAVARQTTWPAYSPLAQRYACVVNRWQRR